MITGYNAIINIALIATLGIATYCITKTIAGKWWALLGTFFVLGNGTVIASATGNINILLGPVAALIAIGCFGQFIEKPSRTMLTASGIALGLALGTHPEGIILLPAYVALLTTHLVATIVRDWNETDEHMRKNRFYVRTIHYLRGGTAIIGIGLLIFYGIAFIQTNEPRIATNNLAINWLLGNPALRPIGTQALTFIATRHATERMQNILPTWSLITLGIIVALRTLIRVTKKLAHAADELTLHYTKWILAMFITLFTALHYSGLPNYIFLTLLPLFAIFATETIKTWFGNVDPLLRRNLHINVVLTENTRLAVSLKTALLVSFIAWYLVENISNVVL